jgi:hypothetical protein
MKTTTKTIYGIKVTAYKDSGAEWVVQAGEARAYRFDSRKWTMKAAMEFAARVEA